MLIEEGVAHSLQRGDTVVVTLAVMPSTQQRMLFQRQLKALFPTQKVVILDPGMTFQVYSAEPEKRQVAAFHPPAPAPVVEPVAEAPSEPEPTPPTRRRT